MRALDTEALAWVLVLHRWGGEESRPHLEHIITNYGATWEPWQAALREASAVLDAGYRNVGLSAASPNKCDHRFVKYVHALSRRCNKVRGGRRLMRTALSILIVSLLSGLVGAGLAYLLTTYVLEGWVA